MQVGFVLLAIGCFLTTALFVARRAIATSMRVMECTAEALGDMQQIFIAPLSFSAGWQSRIIDRLIRGEVVK